MITDYTVRGMTCEHCAASVRAEVGKLAGVSIVTVDLSSGRVSVTHDEPVSDRAVTEAVEEAGYAVVGG